MCSEHAVYITSIALQVHGGMGYVEETEQQTSEMPNYNDYEGTTGIQANDLIGRKFINDNGSAMNELLDQIENDRRIKYRRQS